MNSLLYICGREYLELTTNYRSIVQVVTRGQTVWQCGHCKVISVWHLIKLLPSLRPTYERIQQMDTYLVILIEIENQNNWWCATTLFPKLCNEVLLRIAATLGPRTSHYCLINESHRKLESKAERFKSPLLLFTMTATDEFTHAHLPASEPSVVMVTRLCEVDRFIDYCNSIDSVEYSLRSASPTVEAWTRRGARVRYINLALCLCARNDVMICRQATRRD